jgi:hypothetical protein
MTSSRRRVVEGDVVAHRRGVEPRRTTVVEEVDDVPPGPPPAP